MGTADRVLEASRRRRRGGTRAACRGHSPARGPHPPPLPPQCKFGTLVRDERCGDLFEALNGTLRAAKRKKVIHFEGEMLLQGAHDAVDIVLLKEEL